MMLNDHHRKTGDSHETYFYPSKYSSDVRRDYAANYGRIASRQR
jgi:hypothetical protein